MAESASALMFAQPPRVARRKPRRSKVEQQILDRLATWRAADRLGDCPLAALYHDMKSVAPRLTVGQFHDAVRSLHATRAIYLHPWTGPLYEIPDPALALLVGHEIAYYASWRESANPE